MNYEYYPSQFEAYYPGTDLTFDGVTDDNKQDILNPYNRTKLEVDKAFGEGKMKERVDDINKLMK